MENGCMLLACPRDLQEYCVDDKMESRYGVEEPSQIGHIDLLVYGHGREGETCAHQMSFLDRDTLPC